MDDLEKLAIKRQKQREYAKASYWRKKNGEGPRPPGRPANTPDVLWSKVDKKGEDECWNWLGFKNEDGYGRVQINDWQYYAHRVIYNLVFPDVINIKAPKLTDEKGFLLHTCDNPSCCNPKHLWVGTHKENMEDKVKKNRQKRFPSDTGPRCKLTMQQAKEARQLRKEGISTRELALRFGLSLPSMKTLIRGDSYKE
jgi:hypothetical protein